MTPTLARRERVARPLAATALCLLLLALAGCEDPAATTSGGGATSPGGGGAAGAPAAEKPLRLALIFDEGGLGDRSFNDSAYAGMKRAQTEFAIDAQYAEPSQASDRATFLHQYSNQGYDIVIGVGFLFTEDIRKAAKQNPAVKYVCVDYSLQQDEALPPNLTAIRFREHEGCFLVGALAAMQSASGTIGFVGGAEGPLIKKFEKGYVAGARHVKPDIAIKIAYAGVTGEAFSNPTKGKELAMGMIDDGADIIFHAAGTTGFGVFNACKQRGAKAIGVDADQSDPKEYPDVILTSMLKRTDNAVHQVLSDAAIGQAVGGLREFGLAEDGVGYVLNESNRHMIPQATVDRLEELKAKIVAGEIVVPFE